MHESHFVKFKYKSTSFDETVAKVSFAEAEGASRRATGTTATLHAFSLASAFGGRDIAATIWAELQARTSLSSTAYWLVNVDLTNGLIATDVA